MPKLRHRTCAVAGPLTLIIWAHPPDQFSANTMTKNTQFNGGKNDH